MDGLDVVFFWTDSSRMDTRCTGASVAWCNPEWKMQWTYLGTNKEVFYAELYVIGEALGIALRNRQME